MFKPSSALAGAVLLALLLVTGCVTNPVPQTPRQQVAAAEIAFDAAIDRLLALKAAGLLTPDDLDALEPIARSASVALDTASLNVRLGLPPGAELAVAASAIAELNRVLLEREANR